MKEQQRREILQQNYYNKPHRFQIISDLPTIINLRTIFGIIEAEGEEDLAAEETTSNLNPDVNYMSAISITTSVNLIYELYLNHTECCSM